MSDSKRSRLFAAYQKNEEQKEELIEQPTLVDALAENMKEEIENESRSKIDKVENEDVHIQTSKEQSHSDNIIQNSVNPIKNISVKQMMEENAYVKRSIRRSFSLSPKAFNNLTKYTTELGYNSVSSFANYMFENLDKIIG